MPEDAGAPVQLGVAHQQLHPPAVTGLGADHLLTTRMATANARRGAAVRFS